MKTTDVNHLMDCIEQISESINRKSKFSDSNIESTSKYTSEIATYLGSTERQAFWFAILYALNLMRAEIDLDDISGYLNCSIITIYKYMDDMDELVRLKALRKLKSDRRRRRVPERLDSMKFYIPAPVMLSISKGENSLPNLHQSNLTIYELLDSYGNLLQERYSELLNQNQFDEEATALISANQHLDFFKITNGYSLSYPDLFILLYVCCEFTDFEEANLLNFLKTYYSDSTQQMVIRKQFLNGTNRLQKLKLIDISGDNFQTDYAICLTEHAKDLFFGLDKELFSQQVIKKNDIIVSSEIIPVKLFFNKREEEQIQELQDLLKPANFTNICSRLKESGLRTGFNILLFGPAGTGKSQVCYNLAHECGRGLFKAAIEQTRSKWHGESERLIAELFDRYSNYIKVNEQAPIMFLNECDGILSRRVTVNSSVAQTQNSMQNIILERMESLQDGIILATTNLTQNLDSAFSRRFIYRIELTPPDNTIRYQILKDKIPGLNEYDYLSLADEFQLSGGQVENISRKFILHEVLYGKRMNINQLREVCQQEFILKNDSRNKIGFQL